MLKKIIGFLFSRTMMFAIMAIIQIAIVSVLVMFFSQIGTTAYLIFTIISLFIIIGVVEKDDLNPAYKIMWIILVLIFPITGAVFYILAGGRSISNKKAELFEKIEARVSTAMVGSGEITSFDKETDLSYLRCTKYLSSMASAPLYGNTQTEYFAWGEAFFKRFLEEIDNAKKYIFMEYFIIEEGEMWDKTLQILTKKAAEGIDIRIMFDSFGCLFTLPDKYERVLSRLGIKCEVFNPLRFSMHVSDYTMLNHRDHRKITIIDGDIGFTGGLNFADEYINVKKKHGKWKDTGFMLKGPGVYSLTITFLKMWDFVSKSETKFSEYKPTTRFNVGGYVQPYCDSPIDGETVSEYAYLNVISRAQKYVYIVTPYLVIDHEMITALCLAAKSGIDVRIIVPGIPDKWYVFYVTQSFYSVLLKAGVRIFEYTPGFVHAKMYISDSNVAIVGSANMDYRSLYLHFENCCAFYGGEMPTRVENDVLEVISQSREINLQNVERTNVFKRILQLFLRFFAPMM